MPDSPSVDGALPEGAGGEEAVEGMPAGVVAFTTTRQWGSFGLGGDEPVGPVMDRWRALQQRLAAEGIPRLASAHQVHGAVVAPHGEFTMGAGDDEAGARDNERPAHGVRFERGFALAVRETSVAEFARFVAATGYRTVAERRGRSTVYDERGGAMVELRGAHWRRGYQGRTPAAPDDPVIHIAFDDAVA